MPPPDRFVKKPCKEDGDTDFNQGVADAGEHLPLSTMVVVAKVLLKLQRHCRHKVATKNGTSECVCVCVCVCVCFLFCFVLFFVFVATFSPVLSYLIRYQYGGRGRGRGRGGN